MPKNAATPTTTPAWFAKQTTCGASVAPAHFAGDRVHAVLGAYLSSSHDKVSNHDRVVPVIIPIKSPAIMKAIKLSSIIKKV